MQFDRALIAAIGAVMIATGGLALYLTGHALTVATAEQLGSIAMLSLAFGTITLALAVASRVAEFLIDRNDPTFK